MICALVHKVYRYINRLVEPVARRPNGLRRCLPKISNDWPRIEADQLYVLGDVIATLTRKADIVTYWHDEFMV
jgi:hypothetical protein